MAQRHGASARQATIGARIGTPGETEIDRRHVYRVRPAIRPSGCGSIVDKMQAFNSCCCPDEVAAAAVVAPGQAKEEL
jgi:hypothetical protein